MQKIVIFISGLIVFCLCGCFHEEARSPVDPGPDTTDTTDTVAYHPDTVLLAKPKGFPPIPSFSENPLTAQGIKLGRMLFYDPILSGDSTQSCASCHSQAFGFTDNGKRFSTGIDGIQGGMNAPNIINPLWNKNFFWDGRAPQLEDQALGPVANPIEMHLSWQEAVKRLNRHVVYSDQFKRAFGTRKIDSTLVVKAIAQFERTFISASSKFDEAWNNGGFAGLVSQLSASEFRGFVLFNDDVRGECFHCHGQHPLFTDQAFHNTGLDSTVNGLGLGQVNGNSKDFGKWKTPTLRNLVFTGPYMHDGRFDSLEQVINFYSEEGPNSENLDPLLFEKGRKRGLKFTDQEKQDLIAYLKTLTDSSFIANPDFGNPFK